MIDDTHSERRMKTALVFLDGTTVNASDERRATAPGRVQALPATTVDGRLILIDEQVAPAERTAMEICLLYALSAARAENENAEANSRPFLDAVIKQLGDLGLVVTSTRETTRSKVFDLADALTGIGSRYLDGVRLTAFDAVNHALQRGAAPDQTLEVLRNWWTPDASGGTATAILWAMISQADGRPSLTLLYLDFSQGVTPDYSAAEGFYLTAFATTLALDMTVYAAMQAALRARLGGAIGQYIQHTTLYLTV
jgi:hypothetical protein